MPLCGSKRLKVLSVQVLSLHVANGRVSSHYELLVTRLPHGYHTDSVGNTRVETTVRVSGGLRLSSTTVQPVLPRIIFNLRQYDGRYRLYGRQAGGAPSKLSLPICILLMCQRLRPAPIS